MTSAPARRYASILTVLAGGLIYLLAAGRYVERGMANPDEGFYAYASYAVVHGQVPYRDFAYTQMPLLPYLQGAIMSFTGFGIRQQRWIDACLGALAAGLGVALWRKAKLGIAGCLVLTVAWCTCGPLVFFSSIGKTYAMSELLLIAAAASLSIDTTPQKKLWLLSFFGTLAVGCRLTVAPCVAVLWLGLLLLHRKQISWVQLCGTPLLVSLAMLGPFFAACPDNAVYWN